MKTEQVKDHGIGECVTRDRGPFWDLGVGDLSTFVRFTGYGSSQVANPESLGCCLVDIETSGFLRL